MIQDNKIKDVNYVNPRILTSLCVYDHQRFDVLACSPSLEARLMLGVVRYVKKVKASAAEVTEDLTPSTSRHVLAPLQPLPLAI